MDSNCNKPHTDQTLDPDDWSEMRELGYRMVDEMMHYLESVRERPIWQPIPEGTKKHFQQSVPEGPSSAASVFDEFVQHILPYNKNNIHPRFWAWVQGTGTPVSVLSDMLASTMNANVTIGEQSPMYVDKQVVNWCCQMMGYPDTASGMLVSGASMANLTALLVARNSKLGDVRKKGLAGLSAKPVLYCSAEAHSCIDKAVEVMGLGSQSLRKIPVLANFTMDLDQLRTQISNDIEQGFTPFALIATAGTVNTGAIDPIADMLQIAAEYKLWLHVDGAFGALARLVPSYREHLEGIHLADSIAFDLHKWMYVPYEVGCVLVRDKDLHRQAFSNTPTYLIQHERGLASGMDSLNNYGIELSRGFKALKVWMAIKHYGISALAGQIQKNIEQAQYLAHRIAASASLELMSPVSLNIVCFRFIILGKTAGELNDINKEIVMQLQETGIASPSYAILNKQYCIRVAITNHRSITSDFDLLIETVLQIGNKLHHLENRSKNE